MIALITAGFQKCGRLGIGASYDDAGHVHDIELEARGIETLDLLVCCNQHLAGLMAALLHPRLLILDMIPRHTNFHEPADEIADLPVAAMAGIGVCDNERPEVDRVRGASLLFAHARPGEILVLVRGEQSANNGRSLVGNLAQRITGQIRAGILRDRAFRRGGPPAQIDALDAVAFHSHGLARGVGAKGRNLLPLIKKAHASENKMLPPLLWRRCSLAGWCLAASTTCRA